MDIDIMKLVVGFIIISVSGVIIFSIITIILDEYTKIKLELSMLRNRIVEIESNLKKYLKR